MDGEMNEWMDINRWMVSLA